MKQVLSLLIISIAVSGCAVYRADYANPEEKLLTGEDIPDTKAAYTLYLIGDAGKPSSATGEKTIALLKEKLRHTNGESAVIFLGDNVYKHGLPPDKDHRDRERSENILDIQINATRDFKGKVFFMAGNHDWIPGLEAIEEQADYVEEKLDDNQAFRPKPGCGGPEVEEINDNLVLVFLDSQWWMENWNEHREINEGCEIQNRTEYIDEIEEVFKKYQEKTIVLAMHHPLFTYGSHGGQFAFSQFIFPFRDLNTKLFIPFPFIGSTLRRQAGIPQDNEYPAFQELKNQILNKAEGYDNIIFVSGHEHNLQFIEEQGHSFIVSGAGSKNTPGRAGGPAKYTSGQGGIVEMRFFNDGSAWTLFHNATTRKTEYIKQVRPSLDTSGTFDFTEYYEGKKSVMAPIYYADDLPSGFQRLSWGKLNRSKYYTLVKAPVLDLGEEGLSVIKKGGGNQTNSLRLADKDGKEYVLRSLRKDGSRLQGGMLKGTFMVKVLNDIYTFSHPYAAFILPPMAEAIDIYHTNPRLVYVPKQPALGNYNKEYGGTLYLLEARPDDDRSDMASFGRSENIISTYKMVRDNVKNYKHQVDQPFFLRNRLFDMVIGDWDRHEDQWRWAEFESDTSEITILKAIPRDRDQVFSQFDGFMPQLINKTIPVMRQFQSFGPEIENIKWYNNYARYLDRRFLAELTWDDWIKQVRVIQNQLTDSIIEYSVKQFPESIYAIDGEEIIRNIKARRSSLHLIAREYYLLLAENVDVVGTEDEDRFEITRMPGGVTKVKVTTKGKDDAYHLRYRRDFYPSETKDIRCYGLNDDDVFIVTGEGEEGILVRLIGGYDGDKVTDTSRVKGWSRKTKIYDDPDGVAITGGTETVNNTSIKYDLNNYNFKEYARNFGIFWPTASYNNDFGFSIGGNYNYRTYSFKKLPFAQSHTIKAGYSFNNHALVISYEGLFTQALGSFDMVVNGLAQSPRFTVNYFGMGNESARDLERSRSYHQVRQQEYMAAIGLRYPYAYSGHFTIQPFFQSIRIERTPDRFISENAVTDDLPARIFDHMEFAGTEIKITFDSRNSKTEPTQGIDFVTAANYTKQLGAFREIGKFSGRYTLYQSIDRYGKVTWATQIGWEHIIGDYLFFQSAYVGGPQSLRGYRAQRFRGRTSFFNSNDIRWNIGEVRNKIVPFDIGVSGSFDHGRVWLDNEYSQVWHYTVGGGVFMVIFDITAVNFSYHKGADNGQFLFGLNFDF